MNVRDIEMEWYTLIALYRRRILIKVFRLQFYTLMNTAKITATQDLLH